MPADGGIEIFLSENTGYLLKDRLCTRNAGLISNSVSHFITHCVISSEDGLTLSILIKGDPSI